MRAARYRIYFCVLGCVMVVCAAQAATKIHVIAFGKWMPVQWYANPDAEKPLTLKVRALVIDGRVKEYVVGSPHEVTERLMVVRRMFRVNDAIPEDANPRWQWQRGGWLLVDRTTGHVSAINLAEFDVFYSAASWYRDYVAYCGVSDDGKKTYAIVAQLSRRKPVLKKSLSDDGVADNAAADSACLLPTWQRDPVRVSFQAAGGVKQTFAIRGHVVDVVNDAEEEE